MVRGRGSRGRARRGRGGGRVIAVKKPKRVVIDLLVTIFFYFVEVNAKMGDFSCWCSKRRTNLKFGCIPCNYTFLDSIMLSICLNLSIRLRQERFAGNYEN
jgi:hypothetical protein